MEKQIKMSLETAKLIFEETKKNSNPTNLILYSWLMDNFTKEELEPKKGFTIDDLGYFSQVGYWIGCDKTSGFGVSIGQSNINPVFKTEEQALSSLAFAQLSHIVAKYNEGKKTGPSAFSIFCFISSEPELRVNAIAFSDRIPHLLFHTIADAETSLEVNRDLWNQYWMINA